MRWLWVKKWGTPHKGSLANGNVLTPAVHVLVVSFCPIAMWGLGGSQTGILLDGYQGKTPANGSFLGVLFDRRSRGVNVCLVLSGTGP